MSDRDDIPKDKIDVPWAISDDTGNMYELNWADELPVMIYKDRYEILLDLVAYFDVEPFTRDLVYRFANGLPLKDDEVDD